MQVVYKGVAIREPLFIDVVVEDKVLIEVKATEKNHPIYETQVLTYLRLTGIKLGLLVNFGAPYVKMVFHELCRLLCALESSCLCV